MHAIAQAARALDEGRLAWLNPPDADAKMLKNRTLTNLNQSPTWLANLHAPLDRSARVAHVTGTDRIVRRFAQRHMKRGA